MHHLLTKPEALVATCVVAFVIAVAISDMTSRRIPNVLTVGAAGVGLLTNLLTAGASGALTSVLGLITGFMLFLPFYVARGFSAGDVKAMAAVGAFLGPKAALLAAAWILVAGALAAVILLVSLGGRSAVKALVHRWSARAWMLVATGTSASIPPTNDTASQRFPYGLAIACGTVVSLAWR